MSDPTQAQEDAMMDAALDRQIEEYELERRGLVSCPPEPEEMDSGPSSAISTPFQVNYTRLSPTQRAVYGLLSAYPDGVCRRDFANLADIYEVSNRISEIEQRLGITIQRDVCKRHNHRQKFTLYRI